LEFGAWRLEFFWSLDVGDWDFPVIGAWNLELFSDALLEQNLSMIHCSPTK
jgi:hypothetical protein